MACIFISTSVPGAVVLQGWCGSGLAALVAHPSAEPVFSGVVLAGKRRSWSPYADPRLEVLVACYELVLGASAGAAHIVNEEAAE